MNRLFKTLMFSIVVACCVASAYANVPPLDISGISGNLITRRDAEGAETQYSFDNLNRLVGVEYPDAKTAGYAYDKAGNMHSATNADAALTFGYDPMNRITAVTSSVLSVSSVVNYSHDKNGNRTGITLPGNKTITYTYDEANRLSTFNLSAFSISAFSFSYDDANRLTGITYPNGVTAAYTYDDGGRLNGLTYAKSGSAFIDRAYTYNALGQITKRTITAGLEAVPPDTHQHLRHNAADQLTHVSRMDNYEQPERWRDVGPAYDANGAVTNITTRYNGMTLDSAFSWDYEGRLKSYSGEHQTNLWFTAPPIPSNLAFKYDALGGRVTRSGPTGGEKIHVLDQAANLKNVLVQRASNGTIERYYIYAPGFGLVAHIDADGTARYYHGDHLGSTIALTDSSGNVTDQFNYTPYGELMGRTGTTYTPYTFCGRHGVYWEGGVIYHMKARYYRADLARFISQDPIGVHKLLARGGIANLYQYGNNSPLVFVDPDGEFVTAAAIIGLAAAAVIFNPTELDRPGGAGDSIVGTVGFVGATVGTRAAVQGAGSVVNRLRSSGVGNLVHLTDDASAASIRSQQMLRGPVYATSESLVNAPTWQRVARTGLSPSSTTSAINIPKAAQSAFSRPVPVGPFSAWQRLAGTHTTSAGSLSLRSGQYAATGVNWNQATIYTADALIDAGVAYGIYSAASGGQQISSQPMGSTLNSSWSGGPPK